MVEDVFIWLVVTVIGIIIGYYGFENRNILCVMLGIGIVTMGLGSGASIMVSDLNSQLRV